MCSVQNSKINKSGKDPGGGGGDTKEHTVSGGWSQLVGTICHSDLSGQSIIATRGQIELASPIAWL